MDFTLLQSWWATVEAGIGRITGCLCEHQDHKLCCQAASTVKYQQWPYPDYYIFKNAETRQQVISSAAQLFFAKLRQCCSCRLAFCLSLRLAHLRLCGVHTFRQSLSSAYCVFSYCA